MVKKLLNVIFLLIVGCSIGSQGVYIEEMSKKPALIVSGDTLTVKTSNSIRNSALSIYSINVYVDQTKKECYLSAEQATGKEFKDTFVIDLKSYKIDDATAFEYYWIDPDKKSNKLEITKVVN